ncbi:MAG TPA: serine/threonine-protein kinase [Candidatus Dormibacteraeota bacterium]|nr:serine/threonine-protein kinase [Candidatus Dormibacteraeota bacterium]
MKIAAGAHVGPYEVIGQVGRGGMATVFKAYQPALEREVAIKVLPEFLAEDPQFRERFRREAVAVAKLRHPGILAVYDHGEFEGQPYIVTEFVEGGTFADELGKPITLGRALDVLRSVASALDYAHKNGILHRDVKPSNILMTKEGKSVLGDFGLARMMASNERLTRLDTVVGTPEYMSPEQCMGRETGPASDQYALGVVAFEAMTGHVPYEAETPAAVMLAQMQSPLPNARSVNPAVPAGVEAALERALAKDPANRFAGCESFIKALEAAATEPALAAPTLSAEAPVVAAPVVAPLPGPTVPAAAPATAAPRRRRVDRRLLLIAAAALVVILAAGGVVYALASNQQHTTAGPQLAFAHGSLIYDLTLDRKAWSQGGDPSPDPAGSATVAYVPGKSIDIHITQDGAGVSGEFDGPSLKNYVSDLAIRATPGSDFELNWAVRGQGPDESAEVGLNVVVGEEAMTLYLSPNVGDNQALTPTLPVPGIQSGKIVHIGFVVDGQRIQLFLDGRKVADINESKATGATSPRFYMDGKSGTLQFLSLRYYAVA